MYTAVFHIPFTSAAVILLSLALMVQFSLPYNKGGRAGVMYNIILVFFKHNFILVFFKVFCGVNTLLVIFVSFK